MHGTPGVFKRPPGPRFAWSRCGLDANELVVQTDWHGAGRRADGRRGTSRGEELALPNPSGPPWVLVSVGDVRTPHLGSGATLLDQGFVTVPAWGSDLHILGDWRPAWESVCAEFVERGAWPMDLFVLGGSGDTRLRRYRLLLPPPSPTNGRGRASLACGSCRPGTVGSYGRILSLIHI